MGFLGRNTAPVPSTTGGALTAGVRVNIMARTGVWTPRHRTPVAERMTGGGEGGGAIDRGL